jgi:hypothetical protein
MPGNDVLATGWYAAGVIIPYSGYQFYIFMVHKKGYRTIAKSVRFASPFIV